MGNDYYEHSRLSIKIISFVIHTACLTYQIKRYDNGLKILIVMYHKEAFLKYFIQAVLCSKTVTIKITYCSEFYVNIFCIA